MFFKNQQRYVLQIHFRSVKRLNFFLVTVRRLIGSSNSRDQTILKGVGAPPPPGTTGRQLRSSSVCVRVGVRVCYHHFR